MAIKNYSSLTTFPASVAYVATDTFNFDVDSISAADIVSIAVTLGNVVITVNDGGSKAITFTGLTSIAAILKTYFTFADGSQLVVGDGLSTTTDATKTNALLSTDGSDYLYATSTNDSASYALANAAVKVDLDVSGAQDTIGAGSDELANGVRNVIGSKFNDTLFGDENANILDGGLGVDTMDGEDGGDTYLVTAGDIVEDTGASGTDIVKTSVDFVLQANSGIEELQLSGTASGTGDEDANTIKGSTAANVIDGGAGADTLIGNGGGDTFIVDDIADNVAGGVGTDVVISSLAGATGFTLTNASLVETLRLVGSALKGTGNNLANTIIGNSLGNTLDGGTGNDILTDLLGGADTLIGGTGADVLRAGKGNDILIGGTDETTGDGTAIDNMFGGSGDDTYYVTTSTDIVNEAAGTIDILDEVNITVKYALNDTTSAGVENMNLIGTIALNDAGITGTGNKIANAISVGVDNQGKNTLIGGLGADTLTGGNGDDVLIGGIDKLAAEASVDTMTGGNGNDTYHVTTAGDIIVEGTANTNSTADEVQTTVNYDLTLSTGGNDRSGIEKLTLVGTGNINGIGNDLINIMVGNSGTNTLNGGEGNDIITDTLGGNNTLIGGNGNDTLTAGAGKDKLYDSVNEFTVDVGAGINTLTGGAGDDIFYVTKTNTLAKEKSTDTGVDTVNTIDDYALGNTTNDNGVEKLILAGTFVAAATGLTGTGNDLANTITVAASNEGDNTLIGGTGADLLVGGKGDDILAATLVATATADSSANTMTGGLGEDTYYVSNSNDVINEATVSGDNDTVNSVVNYVLNDSTSVGVEDLNLTGAAAVNGTGNSIANKIVGNDLANTIIGGEGGDTLTGGNGDDILIGGKGIGIADGDVDTLIGGAGKDKYYVTETTDVTKEAALATVDAVQTTVDATLDTVYATLASGTYTISDSSIENLTLLGTLASNATGNASANYLTGNSANNTLTGGDGDDTLDGLTGVDTMKGGNGNDLYYVDNTSDLVTETAVATDSTADKVISTADYTLKANVEILELKAGSSAVLGAGNASNNVINGNSNNNTINGAAGADELDGKAGKDTFNGGDGEDVFIFSAAGDSTFANFDVITDYNNDSLNGDVDQIDLSALNLSSFNLTAISSSATSTTNVGDLTLNYFISGSNTILVADTNAGAGDNLIDFKIQLTGFTGALTVDDFIL